MPPAGAFRYARVLSIAGSDSGGGAGVQADLKTFAALGCYGSTAITALTAQNTLGVDAVQSVGTRMLQAQIRAVLGDIGADAIKIGMLTSAAQVRTVAKSLALAPDAAVVLDPVLRSSSGTDLAGDGTVQALLHTLLRRVRLITPNLDEAGALLGRRVTEPADMERAGLDLLALGAAAVLVKGGHLAGDQVADVLLQTGVPPVWMQAPRIHSRNTHGTGCTLSSAIAAHLALGASLPSAVTQARAFVRAALLSGAAATLGQGRGALDHGHAPRAAQHLPLA